MLAAIKPDFESLVDAHSGELFGYLWRLLGDEAEAEDCLQDTYLRAYKAYERATADNLRAWLYKIATNTARTRLQRNGRRDHRQTELHEQLASGEARVEAQVQQRISLAAVRAAVSGLPRQQQAALLLRKYQGLEYAEVAAALGCSEPAARAHVYQALKKLRTQFSEEDHD
ncbi:MAG: RNA polymerase sigma factor [Anaerolineales bacterium]|nr:RNA polymerase sigma factor [Anaerolineales bacterium]QYK49859.1 MAG: RNA polymerase sigma factor [Anaerolineales bacterium]